MKIDLIKLKINSIFKFITYKENKELIKIYSADWRKRFSNICLGVAFPKSTSEVSKIVKFASENNLKLIPQGTFYLIFFLNFERDSDQ